MATAREMRDTLFAIGNQDAPVALAILHELGFTQRYGVPTARQLRSALYDLADQDVVLPSWARDAVVQAALVAAC